MRRLDCDILIVGSGAAGGVLAATLSELTPFRIVVAEKGGHYTSSFFNQREWDMNVLYAGEGARSTSDGAIPVRGGECVGGGTTVNVALCFDPVPEVWQGWARELGLEGFSFDPEASDHGIVGLNMPSALEEVRRRINVHIPPASSVNDNNRLFELGCERMGISSRRFQLNMRGCVECGFCPQGCSYDAKQGTMLTYLADAQARGVQLVHHFEVEQLSFARGRAGMAATGARGSVRPTGAGSLPNSMPPGPLEISAKLVIVAAGAIETPSLLQRSRLPDPGDLLGRGLIIHPSLPIIGMMGRELVNYRGISGTAYSDHFYRSDGFYYECLFGHPVYGAVVMPNFGTDHFDRMLKYREIAGFGVMLVDTVDPENRVKWDAGVGRSRIRYKLGPGDKARMRTAARTGIEIMFAAGAREVLLPSEEPIGSLPMPRFTRPQEAVHCADLQFLPHQTTITSSHAQATVKMGEDPDRCPIDSRGESRHARNLLVCDSSAFPSSCGANPMLSIMAMARYQGRRIAAERAHYGL